MSGMDILAITQHGLDQAQGQFEKAAQRLAQVGADSQAPDDTVSLSDNVVSLVSAKNQFQTEIKMAETAIEMQKKTLDLLA